MSRMFVARIAIIVTAALLLTLALGAVAVAQEAAAPSAAASVAPGGTEAESSQEASGEAAGAEAEKEIPHTTGNPTPAQQQDLENAWAGMEGYSILIVGILGLIVACGIVGFGVYKQARA